MMRIVSVRMTTPTTYEFTVENDEKKHLFTMSESSFEPDISTYDPVLETIARTHPWLPKCVGEIVASIRKANAYMSQTNSYVRPH